MSQAATPTKSSAASSSDSPPGAVPGVERGCGRRQEGGIYLETGLSENGLPIECFWADPPIPHEVDKAVGQVLVRRDGTFHVVDWIGQDGYPYPTDLLEEARSYGLSRRISPNFDFEKLTPESRIILVHGRAVATSPKKASALEEEVLSHDDQIWKIARFRSRCVLLARSEDLSHVDDPTAGCCRFWYLDAEANTNGPVREIASTEYYVLETDEDLEMESGIIASFPISRLATVEATDGSHEDRHQMLSETTEIPNVVTEA